MPDPKWHFGTTVGDHACHALHASQLRHLMVPNSGHIVGGRQIQALADPISAFLDGVVLRQDRMCVDL